MLDMGGARREEIRTLTLLANLREYSVRHRMLYSLSGPSEMAARFDLSLSVISKPLLENFPQLSQNKDVPR